MVFISSVKLLQSIERILSESIAEILPLCDAIESVETTGLEGVQLGTFAFACSVLM